MIVYSSALASIFSYFILANLLSQLSMKPNKGIKQSGDRRPTGPGGGPGDIGFQYF